MTAGRILLALFYFGTAGCAAMQMTLAQELAWKQWKSCDNFPTVTLKEVRVDGQIWVNYYSRGEYADWVKCIEKARNAQAGRIGAAGTAKIVTPGLGTTPTSSANAVAAPVWKRGHEWAYRWESPRGQGTFVWVVDGEEIIDGIPVYVVRMGTQRRGLYRRGDLAFYLDEYEGQVETRFVPPFVAFAWPLEPGKSWQQEVTRERPKERTTEVISYSCQVAQEAEDINVAAGSFRTWRVSCRNTKTGIMAYESWYAAAVAQWIKQKAWFDYGVRGRELIQYRLR